MKKLAQNICDKLHDYHNYNGFKFTSDHVIKWVSQFETSDQVFILEEFLHLLSQGIYISEEKAKELLLSAINQLASYYKFDKVIDFLKNVEFLRLQSQGKSQSTILELVGELLFNAFGVKIADCGTKSKRYALYLDDIIATGNSVRRDLKTWLLLKNSSGKQNLDDVIEGNKIVIINVFCRHTWPDVGWRLKMDLGKDEIRNKIFYRSDYKIENHPTQPDQRFNFAYPVKDQPKEVLDYLDSLQDGYGWTMRKKGYAMRPGKKPIKETLFSSPQNRIRFENIILLKGIEILKRVRELNHNQRPMGNINPSFQTFGTGTLFFTWRNISNTTPIVFWWKVNWEYLFPVINRGN